MLLLKDHIQETSEIDLIHDLNLSPDRDPDRELDQEHDQDLDPDQDHG